MMSPSQDYAGRFRGYPLVPQTKYLLFALLIVLTHLSSPAAATTSDAISFQDSEHRRDLVDETTVTSCTDDEILLEISAFTSGGDPNKIYYDWQVIDDTTGEIVKTCSSSSMSDEADDEVIPCYWRSSQEYHDRVCLSSDGCYRLITGEYQNSDRSPTDTVTRLNVKYGGKEIFVGNQTQFQSIVLVTPVFPIRFVKACKIPTVSIDVAFPRTISTSFIMWAGEKNANLQRKGDGKV